MTTIKCTNCGQDIELTEALTKDFESAALVAEHAKHEAEIARVKQEVVAAAAKSIQAVEAKAQAEATAKVDLKLQTILKDAEEKTKDNEELRKQLTTLMQDLRESKKAKENAELEMQKKLAEEEGKIREDAVKMADEKYRLRFAEQEKKLTDTQKALDEAQRKVTQNSQQLQGEVLELDLEGQLRDEFPYDEILEVKKGQRGADVKQIVHNQAGESCGVILWEIKNGKWQPAWAAKFKQDIREANANIGVLVSQETPSDIGVLKQLEGNVWVVSPALATRLATALRITILQVNSANKMNAGKDAKMEALYQFLVGPEFKHRVEAIIESYTLLQEEMEKEKRSYALKWARQEKAIRSVIDNTIGMYGDFQGITNRALPPIKTLELPESIDEVKVTDETLPLS